MAVFAVSTTALPDTLRTMESLRPFRDTHSPRTTVWVALDALTDSLQHLVWSLLRYAQAPDTTEGTGHGTQDEVHGWAAIVLRNIEVVTRANTKDSDLQLALLDAYATLLRSVTID